jgi:hypothetical protein
MTLTVMSALTGAKRLRGQCMHKVTMLLIYKPPSLARCADATLTQNLIAFGIAPGA